MNQFFTIISFKFHFKNKKMYQTMDLNPKKLLTKA